MGNGTIFELLERCAEEHGKRPAIEALGREALDFVGLLDLVRASASALAQGGVGPGERIAVVMVNGPEMATTCLALSASCTCVPLNPEYTEPELCQLMLRLGVTSLVTTPGQSAALQAARALGLTIIEAASWSGAPAGAVEFRFDSNAPRKPRSGERPPRSGSEDVALVLHTSGSTALPKIVPLSHRNLLTSAANVVRSLELGPDDRCLSTMPLVHIGALVDLLLAPLSVGGSVVIAGGVTASEFFTHVDEGRPTWFQGVPTMLQDILHVAKTADRESGGGSLRLVRSVSAPLPPVVLQDFEAYFDLPVIEIYGMTETAGVITSNPLPPGQRRTGSVGIPAGPDVTIIDDAGNAAEPGRLGEVLVRGLNVTSGYEDVPPGESFLNGWLRTGDEGYLDAEGYLHLTGRIKDIINRGGEKIAPREIDDLILGHPGVADAAAFALPHRTLGEEVGLAVVRGPNAEVTAAELIAYCSSRLAPFKVPRTVFFCDELPRAPGGKLQRGRLPEWCRPELAAPEDPQSPGPNPSTEQQHVLLDLWRTALELEDVGMNDDFFDLGGDSLRAAELAEQLRNRLRVEIAPAALFDNPTVARLDAYLGASAPAPDAPGPEKPQGDHRPPDEDDATAEVVAEVRGFLSAWLGNRPTSDSLLVGRNTLGARTPLFWGVQSYGELSDFADGLGADQPVYGMRSLYEAKTKSAENTGRLARRYAAEIALVQPAGPVHLGGYCAGGRIAFLIARELRATGREVASLSLVEHFSPEPYDGRAAFFFHIRSGFHPFKTVGRPWCSTYTGAVSLHPSHANHTDVLVDARVLHELRHELATAESDSRSTAGRSAAVVHATPPRMFFSRGAGEVAVQVANAGSTTWPAGTTVFGRWHRRGSTRGLFDGSARLEASLAPGEQDSTTIPVSAPLNPGLWRLIFEIVPGGNWNGIVVDPCAEHMVVVLPGSATWHSLRRRLLGGAVWSSFVRRLTGRAA